MGASETPRGRQCETAAREAGQDVPRARCVGRKVGAGNRFSFAVNVKLIVKLIIDIFVSADEEVAAEQDAGAQCLAAGRRRVNVVDIVHVARLCRLSHRAGAVEL